MDRDDDEQPAPPSAPTAPLPANPPQVRSRITVVCAECKRLKLKCDRRTPCGSCVKRDTVVRCIYSPAAAEKVDLHSLNNRLIQVEALLAQLQEAPAATHTTTAVATTSTSSNARHPTTPLSVPLSELHVACLADLGFALPSFGTNVTTKVKPDPDAAAAPLQLLPPLVPGPTLLQLLPPPQHIPARLQQAHAALAQLGAAPFPFAWFEQRTYAFLSAMSAASCSSTTSVANTTSSASTASAKAEAKDARRRERDLKRERARIIFAGGANAGAGAVSSPVFPIPSQLFNSSPSTSTTYGASPFASTSTSQQQFNNSPFAAPSTSTSAPFTPSAASFSHNTSSPFSHNTSSSPFSHNNTANNAYAPFDGATSSTSANANMNGNMNSYPPIHTLPAKETPDSMSTPESDAERDDGYDGYDHEEEMDELEEDCVGGNGVQLRPAHPYPHPHPPQSQSQRRKKTSTAARANGELGQGRGGREGGGRQGGERERDPRMAFFALLCAVLALGDSAASASSTPFSSSSSQSFSSNSHSFTTTSSTTTTTASYPGVFDVDALTSQPAPQGQGQGEDKHSQHQRREGGREGREDLAALALRAAEGYFGDGPSTSATNPSPNATPSEADLDAVLAMWVLGVGMVVKSGGSGSGSGREGGMGMEGVYLHLAKTVAHARVVGVDRAAHAAANFHSHSAAASTNGGGQAGVGGQGQGQGTAAQGKGKKRVKEEVMDMQMPLSGGAMHGADAAAAFTAEKGEGREELCARTWWAVVWGDVLVADALGLPPHVAPSSSPQLSSLHPHSNSHLNSHNSPSQQGGAERDPLAQARDWCDEVEGNANQGQGGAGKRFGGWVRFARLLHSIQAGPAGLEGACAAEGAVRAWVAAESGSAPFNAMTTSGFAPFTSSGNGANTASSSYAPMDLDGAFHVNEQGSEREPQEREQAHADAEIALVANRAVLRVWSGWLVPDANAPPYTHVPPPQAVYGAVNAAHGIVQACRGLTRAASSSSSSSSSSPLSTSMIASQPASTATLSSSLALLASHPARALFDAGVVCAYAALRHPKEVFAQGAREGLVGALGMLRDAAVVVEGDVGAYGHGHVNGHNAVNGHGHSHVVVNGNPNVSGTPKLNAQNGHSHANANAGTQNIFASWTGRGEAVRVLEALARRAGLVISGGFDPNAHAIGVIRIGGPESSHGEQEEQQAGGNGNAPPNMNGGHPNTNMHGHPDLNGHGNAHGHPNVIKLNAHEPALLPPPGTLKRKHEAIGGQHEGGGGRHGQQVQFEGANGKHDVNARQHAQHDLNARHAHAQHQEIALPDPLAPVVPASPRKPDKHALALALKEKEREREGKEKKEKKRTYPSVGIRVRPGKEGQGPVSPYRKTSGSASAVVKGAPSPLARTPAEEMGYYPQPTSQQTQPQPQQQQQQQVPSMEAYRSRSSSISQDPRMQPPKEQQPHVVALEFSMPFSSSSASVGTGMESVSGMDYSRRSFAEPPPQQQQGYAGDSASTAMYDLQPPRAGSYEEAYGSVGSPFGNSSGALSTASSPYTTTSVGTPTFGNGGSAHNPSPPNYASQAVPQASAQYYGGGYEPQGYDPAGLAMDGGVSMASVPQTPLYDKSHQQLYEAKPLMDHHAQQQPQYHLEQDTRHEMAWPPPEQPLEQPQYWASDDYKFYPQ